MANTIFYAFVLLAATVTVCTAGFLGSEQVLTATGTVKCGPKPSSGKETWVALEDDEIGKDAKIEQPVNDDGTFRITLKSSHLLDNMDPKLKFYTDCNDGKPCQRKLVMKIPKAYVGTPASPAPVYEAGTFNLEAEMKDESRDCSVRRSWGIGK